MADTTPIRADYRIMKDILTTSFGQAGVSPTPKDLDLVSKVFLRAGGSWEQVFLGSVKDVALLKKTLKAAIDGKHMTLSPVWDG